MSLKMFQILVSALLFTDTSASLECASSQGTALQRWLPGAKCERWKDWREQLEKNKNWVSTVTKGPKSRADAPASPRRSQVHFNHGVFGAPFLTEESANQFIRLKRQIPYSLNYWDPSSSQNTWGYTVAEQVSETWKALKDTAQYYMDLGSSAFNPSIASDIRSYMDKLQQSGTHLQ